MDQPTAPRRPSRRPLVGLAVLALGIAAALGAAGWSSTPNGGHTPLVEEAVVATGVVGMTAVSLRRSKSDRTRPAVALADRRTGRPRSEATDRISRRPPGCGPPSRRGPPAARTV